MSKTNNVTDKKDLVTIQFQVSQEEYADIQRAKIDSGQVTGKNSDFYKEALLRGIQKQPV